MDDDIRFQAKTESDILNLDLLLSAFIHRTNTLLMGCGMKLAQRLGPGIKDKEHPLDVWNDMQVFKLQDVAKTYGDLVGIMEFKACLPTMKDDKTRDVLT